MTKIDNVIFGEEGLSLREANSLLRKYKKTVYLLWIKRQFKFARV